MMEEEVLEADISRQRDDKEGDEGDDDGGKTGRDESSS